MDTNCVSVVLQDQCLNQAVKLPFLPHSSDMFGGGHDGLGLHEGISAQRFSFIILK
jgi:hypothetical protein